MPTTTPATDPVAADQSVDLRGIHHVELWVGNAKQAAYFYRKCFGFDQVAFLGPETGVHDRVSYCLKQGNIFVALSSPLTHLSPMNIWLNCHGDGVRDIAFEVGDVDRSYAAAVARGATPLIAPHDMEAADGAVRRCSVQTYGDTVHSFIERGDYAGFLPGYALETVKSRNVGIHCIDHVVGNVEHRRMDHWCEFYEQIFDFDQFVSFDDKDISTEYTSLRSKVMASEDRADQVPHQRARRGQEEEPDPGVRRFQHDRRRAAPGPAHREHPGDHRPAAGQRRRVPGRARQLLRHRVGPRR